MNALIAALCLCAGFVIVAFVALMWPEESSDPTEPARCRDCGRLLWKDKNGNLRCAQKTEEITPTAFTGRTREIGPKTLARLRKENRT